MSTRPPIPQGNPPAYAFVTRIYKRPLRPVVLVSAGMAGLWTLLWGISSFRDISRDHKDALSDFVPFDIVLGALFCAAAAIELFGITAASMQRLALVRLYAFGTVAAALLVFAAQILNIILDFKFKSKLINQCTTANTGDTVLVSDGWWGTSRKILDAAQASSWCNNIYTRQVVADFAWLIVTIILAALFTSVVFSYYRQLLDPNFSRAPSNQIRMQAFGGYPPPPGAPYGAAYAPGAHYGDQDYVPPYDPSKLPTYDGTGRQTPEKEDDQKLAFGPPQGYSTATNPFERKAEEP